MKSLAKFAISLSFFMTQIVWSQPLIPAAPELAAKAWLLMDSKTGRVLAEQNADEILPPASLTKMMTVYIASEEIAVGRLSEEDMVRVSVNAWEKGGTKSGSSTMFLPPNEDARVIDLLRGVIIQSGNDAAIALAEHIAGDESAFADIMNQQATILGMNNSHFTNSTGWPDAAHMTTARDLAKLAVAVIEDHPEHYSIYSEKEFEYNGIKQPNRNQLLWRDSSIDGLKTGYTEEAGYGLVGSAKKDDRRIIFAITGLNRSEDRARESEAIVNWAFRQFGEKQVVEAGKPVATADVWMGAAPTVGLTVPEDLTLLVPVLNQNSIDAEVVYTGPIEAPITAGQQLGEQVIKLDELPEKRIPLVAETDVARGGFGTRLRTAAMVLWQKFGPAGDDGAAEGA